MRTYKATIVLEEIMAEDDDDIKEIVKDALRDILDEDDSGEGELNFTLEESDDETF